MKFVVVALLLACLVQGNNAQFGLRSLGSLLGTAGTYIGSGLSTAANSQTADYAKKAVNCWLGWCDEDGNVISPDGKGAGDGAEEAAPKGKGPSAAVGAAVIIGNMPGMESLSAASEGLLGSALSGMPEDELIVLADDLTLSEHLDTILAAQIAVSEQSNGVANRLRTLVFGPVASTGCAKEKVDEAKELTNTVSEISTRANKLVKEGYFAHRECSEHSTPKSRKRCEGEKMVPVTVGAAIMIKDCNDNTMKAIDTVKVLRRAFGQCARNAKNAAQAQAMTAAVNEAVSGMAADINRATNEATKAASKAAGVAKAAAPAFVIKK